MDSYHAISNILARYTQLVDAGDFEGVGAHLAHCTLSSGATGREWSGAEAITGMYRGALIVDERGSPRTKHLTTNVVIDIDDDDDDARRRGAPSSCSRGARGRSR